MCSVFEKVDVNQSFSSTYIFFAQRAVFLHRGLLEERQAKKERKKERLMISEIEIKE